MLAEHFSASRKELFMLCWCSIGAIAHSGSGHKQGFLCGIPQKITRLLYRVIWDIPRWQPNKVRPFRDAEKLFGIPKNFSACRKKFSASRKDFDLGGFKLVVRSHIFEENMTNSLIRGVIQMGVYGENQVGLGLSRPFGGLACPIKLLPVWIALILAYFGLAGTMYC